jgi:hypothetical protein
MKEEGKVPKKKKRGHVSLWSSALDRTHAKVCVKVCVCVNALVRIGVHDGNALEHTTRGTQSH